MMKLHWPSILLTVFLLVPAEAVRAGNAALEWYSNLNHAARIAAKRNKPIFVVFRCER